MSNYQLLKFSSRDQSAHELARQVGQDLHQSIAQKGSAVVAFSGGSTPKPMLQTLAEYELEWSKVVITLVDERWVPENDQLSNAALMQQYLLNGLAADARFIPLYRDLGSIEQGIDTTLADFADATNSPLGGLRDFDVIVLGMGDDGHTASFFPDANNIADLLDPAMTEPLLQCSSPSTEVPRVTWSLPRVLGAQNLYLHFNGQNKQAVFEQAARAGAMDELPIRSVLLQTQRRLKVYYAD